jgi:hypothetical protein
LAGEAKKSVAAMGKYQAQYLQHAVRMGAILIEAKGRMGHGNFGLWLDKHFDGTSRTAQRYMDLARDVVNEVQDERLAKWMETRAKQLAVKPKTTPVSGSPRVTATVSEPGGETQVEGEVVGPEPTEAPEPTEEPARRHLAAVPYDPTEDEYDAPTERERWVHDLVELLPELKKLRSRLLDGADYFESSGVDVDRIKNAGDYADEALQLYTDMCEELLALVPADRRQELVTSGYPAFTEAA